VAARDSTSPATAQLARPHARAAQTQKNPYDFVNQTVHRKTIPKDWCFAPNTL
jgi:hypothetical protein